MNASDLTEYFRIEADDAPDAAALIAELELAPCAHRRVSPARWSTAWAVAAVLVLLLVTGLITWRARSGPAVPTAPTGPALTSSRAPSASLDTTAGRTTPGLDTAGAFTPVPLPSAALTSQTLRTRSATGLVALSLTDPVSPVTLPDPPAGYTQHTVIAGPRALLEYWTPPETHGSTNPAELYGYVVSTTDPTTGAGTATTAPASSPSEFVGPDQSTPALAQDAVVQPTTIGGRSFVMISVSQYGLDIVSAQVAAHRLAWRLSDGRWIQVFDRNSSATELAQLASLVIERTRTLPRTLRAALTVAGYTDVLTTETLGTNSFDAELTLCTHGTLPGVEPPGLGCAGLSVSPGSISVLPTEPAPVPSRLAGMSAQIDNGVAFYTSRGMSMYLGAEGVNWTRDQMMAVLASASYSPG